MRRFGMQSRLHGAASRSEKFIWLGETVGVSLFFDFDLLLSFLADDHEFVSDELFDAGHFDVLSPLGFRKRANRVLDQSVFGSFGIRR